MKGVSTWRNSNGFFVAQVHYSADPDRDPETEAGKAWRESAGKGMDSAMWRKEYEIDWFALSGEPVYPFFNRSLHVVEPFVIPPEWTRYVAIDPGLRNPTAVLWLAVDPDGVCYVYDEHYVREKTVDWHAKRIMEKEYRAGLQGYPEQEKIFIRLIDPAAKARSALNNVSIIDEYRKCGIACKPANNDVQAGIQRVNRYLAPDATGKPRLFFFSNLVHTINEITNYYYEEISATVAEYKDPEEKPNKKDDHLMDCLRYIIMENPHYVKVHKPGKNEKPPSWDGMTTGYV